MKNLILVFTFAALAVGATVLTLDLEPGFATQAANTAAEPVAVKPGKTMAPFASAKELKDHLAALAEKQRKRYERLNKSAGTGTGLGAANQSASPASSMAMAADGMSESKAEKDDQSITNNQHAGVDEGGIVKLHGEHLVILRRGRLFTVKVGGNSLRPVSSINAYAPGVNPSNDWYDEMLVSDDTVVVIGYSYGRGGTEINLFDIDADGSLEYRSTYHLRSNDYYSSRNYASRLIGSKLVFYTPQYMGYGDPGERFPAVRKWHKGATDKEFTPVVEPTRIYHPGNATDLDAGLALHTVTACDLASREFSCQGTAVLGAPGRVFYVSPTSVYVWTTGYRYDGQTPVSASMLYRMPLDASAPSALKVNGSPVDQFSFLESSDQHLNVLVRSDGRGEAMWSSEFAAGDVALFRTSIGSFSDGSESAPASDYSELPKPEGYTFQNRFVGEHLLYGTGSGWGRPATINAANLFIINYVSGEIHDLELPHGVDRIEQMGRDAVVVGTNGTDLHFSPVKLGNSPRLKKGYQRKNASQGELRSHGFFYKANGRDSGVIGLPIARQGRPGYRHLVENSAAILFIRNNSLNFDEIGELDAQTASTNDKCKASCVDWYGNARPLFIRDRVFALLGYEIVEGTLDGQRIAERRRINYSPRYAKRFRGE